MPKNIYLLTYDLHKDGDKAENYKELYKLIESYDHLKVTDSSYAICSDETAHTLFSRIYLHFDGNDSFALFHVVDAVHVENIPKSDWFNKFKEYLYNYKSPQSQEKQC